MEVDLNRAIKEKTELEEKLNKTEVDGEMRFNYMENELNNMIDEGKNVIQNLENTVKNLNQNEAK